MQNSLGEETKVQAKKEDIVIKCKDIDETTTKDDIREQNNNSDHWVLQYLRLGDPGRGMKARKRQLVYRLKQLVNSK